VYIIGWPRSQNGNLGSILWCRVGVTGVLGTMKFNRRHKVILFLSVLATGLTLLSGRSLAFGFGALCIGLASAWAIGSESKAVHALLLATGLCVLFLNWVTAPEMYIEQFGAYSGRFVAQTEIAKQPLIQDPSFRALPRARQTEMLKATSPRLRVLPSWEQEEVVERAIRNVKEPPPELNRLHTLEERPLPTLVGLTMTFTGLALLLTVRRKAKQGS